MRCLNGQTLACEDLGYAKMNTIKRMTPRRWKKFQQYVSPGTQVRGGVVNGVAAWDGILIENYPYAKEEFFAEECAQGYDRQCMNQLQRQPVLRYQGFKRRREGEFLAMHQTVQFMVDGRWMSLVEILRL